MIRFCYTVATPETADEAMLAYRGPLESSFPLLRSLGYEAAELMIRDPKQLGAKRLSRLASDHGLALPAISTGQLRKEDNLSFTHPDAAQRERAVERMFRVIDFAADIAPQVHIGTLRGPLDPTDHAGSLARARESFQSVAEYAARAGVRLAVEPQCRYVINWLNTLDETASWNGQFSVQAPLILYDLYHAMLEETSPHASLARHFSRIAWVQVSDTNRRAPGLGHWNFPETLRLLDSLGYDGFVSVECLQTPESARQAIECLRNRQER
jgi:sugar phosphate isomerase/epimerase